MRRQFGATLTALLLLAWMGDIPTAAADPSARCQSLEDILRKDSCLSSVRSRSAEKTITVDIAIEASSENPPIISGKTNLPDGTILYVEVFGEAPRCIPGCLVTMWPQTVSDGRFPISAAHDPLICP